MFSFTVYHQHIHHVHILAPILGELVPFL